VAILGAGVLLMATLMAGCASTPRASAPARTPTADAGLRQEIAALCAQMEQAMRENDLKRVASFYADDGILLGPGGDTRGGSRAALEEYWLGFGRGVDWSLVTHSIEGEEGLAIQRGRSILTYVRDDQRRTSVVEFMLIWQRQDDGTLKIKVDAYW
jgi:ketosteroid isomerase-like protein